MPKKVVRYNKEMTFPLKVNSSVTVAEGDLVGVNSSGEAVLADKTQGAIVAGVGVAVTAAAGASGDQVAVAPMATVRGFSSLTPGARQYLATVGGITPTRPTTAGDLIQPAGLALAADTVQFNLAQSGIVAQAAGTTTIG